MMCERCKRDGNHIQYSMGELTFIPHPTQKYVRESRADMHIIHGDFSGVINTEIKRSIGLCPECLRAKNKIAIDETSK